MKAEPPEPFDARRYSHRHDIPGGAEIGGKNSCSLVGLNDTDPVVLRRCMRRVTVIAFTSKLPVCVVAMEACCGAHHLGRIVRDYGHQASAVHQQLAQVFAATFAV